MKKLKYISVVVLFVAGVISVAAQDLERLSEQELTGTARYVGMGGAMTAIGGDPSAVKDNPAGLGVYRRMEISLALDQRLDAAFQSIEDRTKYQYSMTAPQFSWVFAIANDNRDRGVLFNNVMLSFHRLRTYNRSISLSDRGQANSLADVICNVTNGLPAAELSAEDRWDNVNVGWLSNQAYETYLINPYVDDSTQWSSVLLEEATVDNSLKIRETGYVNQYAVDWAMNISNRIFLGAGIRMLSFKYSQSVEYYEKFSQPDGDLLNNTSLIVSGVGLNGSIGVIYHPIQCLRVGASFQTPSVAAISSQNYGDFSSTVTDTLRSSETPVYNSAGNRIFMPLRSSVSVALQMRQYGLLSFQYDYLHSKNTVDLHGIRVGLELVPIQRLFINAGYVYESSFNKKDIIYFLQPNSVRTDTHFQNLLHTQYVSFGVGYRGRHMIAQMAYQLSMQHMRIYAHELATPYSLQTQTHRIVLTIGWHAR